MAKSKINPFSAGYDPAYVERLLNNQIKYLPHPRQIFLLESGADPFADCADIAPWTEPEETVEYIEPPEDENSWLPWFTHERK